MTALLLPLLLLAVALVCAVAYALAKAIGVVIVATAAIVGVVLFASQSSESTMFVGYVVAFGLPFFAAAGALGVFAGKQLREGHFALSALPFLAIGGFVGYVMWSQYAEAREVKEVESFLRGLPQLERLTGGPVRILPATNTTFSAGEPGRREYSLKAKQPLYAVVRVDRSWFRRTRLQLECVTTLSIGQRQAGHLPCAEGVVDLDDTRYAMHAPAAPSQPKAGAAEAAEKRAAEEHLAQQLAKLNAMTAAPSATPSPASTPPPAPRAPPAATPRVPPSADATPALALPANAEVAVVGVYESAARGSAADGKRAAGPVRVAVAPGGTPLVLVLASYEPVQWQVSNQGRPIAAVLLSGYYASTVTGVSAPVTTIGTQYAYKRDGAAYQRLQALIARHTPQVPRHFLGAYAGTEFTVPSQ